MSHHLLTIISFYPKEAEGVQIPYDGALIVEVIIHNFKVQKVLIDDSSKVNLLPYRVYQQMAIPKEKLMRDQAPIKGIGGGLVAVEGKVKLALTMGQAPIH